MDPVYLRNTLFVIGAIIMAIEQGLRSAPDFRSRLPRVLASEYWNFAPLILMIIAGVIWVIHAVEAPKPEIAARPPSIVAPRAGITDGRQWFRVNDADRWTIAIKIRELGMKEQAFSIARYDNAPCEDLGQDLNDIFQAAGWKQIYEPGTLISGHIDKGITIRSQHDSTALTALQNVLTSALGLAVRRLNDPTWTQPYIQIEIGNPPNS
jgi:hypothetical protein